MPAHAKLSMILSALLLLVGALAGCASQAAFYTAPPPPLHAGQYTDKQLYRDIAADVAGGAAYYRAAVELHRIHHYPLKPGFTVRLPTLTLAAAWFGWEALRLAAFAVLAAAALAWLYALRGRATWPERLLAAGLIASSGAMLTGNPVILHERWAGLLLALALALRIGWRNAWPAALAAAGAALAVRELALPFVLLAFAFAVWERRWREAVGWSALIVLFAALMALHLHLVAAQVRPDDLTTQGWTAMAGPAAVIRAIVHTSVLQYLPAPLALVLAVLPLGGWFGLRGRDGLFCLLLFGGYALMIALFARPDNFYWGAVVQPGWFVGLAFLPRGLVRLRYAALGKPAAAPNLAGADAPL